MSRPGRVERQDASCASIRARRVVAAEEGMRVSKKGEPRAASGVHYATGHAQVKGSGRAPPDLGAPAGGHGGLDAMQI
jgi:hypothetical protein